MSMIVLLPIFIGCSSYKPDPKPIPNDGTVIECTTYCTHLRMVCPAYAQPTREGATCETVCGVIETSGFVQNARKCSMQATSCEGVDACER